ncbi:hypothetical protein DFH06DRAFT_1313824 [Mycena polygramma]|nr:hypothetical protein DFH06DRAFT_1313824 [Mycena polygramma]
MSEKTLGLDPGPGPRRVRKTSLCKCVCWSIAIPLFSFAAWTVTSFGASVIQEARFPHKSLYHTEQSHRMGDVIRPLITEEDRFDIAVSVWLRAPEEEEAASRRLNAATKAEEDAPASSQQLELDGLGKIWVALKAAEGNNRFRDEYVLEKPLFSEVVFRGVRLSDKHSSANVNFRLPTARFLASGLTESDLRATFLLLPSSPSLIDHVKNFSSWMPDSVFVKRRPTRPWPFPLGSEASTEKTLADLALESFSISVPLLEFHNATSHCNDDGVESDVQEHPYVVTRTQLRIVRETSLFNASAYNAVRNEIEVHSCGQGIPGIKPNLKMCRRTYKSNGNFETLLELEVPTESGVETQWAYAPYLDTKEHATGPVDIVPVPVSRENCSTSRDAGSEYMDINWRIAYSGRTPGKQVLGDNFVSPQFVDHRASDLKRLSQQNEAEMWNGALGHRFHDDAHPRRRLGIQIVSGACLVIYGLLVVYYWWTRVSTVGISTSSVAFLVVGNILGPIVETLQSDDPSLTFILPTTLFVPFLMCKCIARVEFEWRKWYPTVNRSPANHRERASQRIDNRTSWWTKLLLFAALVATYQLLDPQHSYLIPTTVPAPTAEEFPQSKLLDFLLNVYHSLFFTGTVSQILLNHRSRLYGGGYRSEVIMFFLANVIGLLYFVPAVVGRMEMRQGLGPFLLIDMGVQLPLVWQAITLPPAEDKGDEDD